MLALLATSRTCFESVSQLTSHLSPQTTSKLLSSGVVRDAATTQRLDALATELLSSRVYGGAGAPAHTRKAALAVLSAAR